MLEALASSKQKTRSGSTCTQSMALKNFSQYRRFWIHSSFCTL